MGNSLKDRVSFCQIPENATLDSLTVRAAT